MASTLYSFADISFVISHPAVGQYVANGSGIGSIKVTMTTDRTKHDVAADGSVMVTRVEGNNGTIALAIQQSSALHQWLVNLYNYVRTSDPSQWALASITISSPLMLTQIYASGVSFQILTEQDFGADGAQFTWDLMAADIDSMVI
jgi:hypothetical protein